MLSTNCNLACGGDGIKYKKGNHLNRFRKHGYFFQDERIPFVHTKSSDLSLTHVDHGEALNSGSEKSNTCIENTLSSVDALARWRHSPGKAQL